MAAVAAGPGTAPGASSGTVVSATVPSATSLNVAGCASNSAGRTDLGLVQPGASVVTTLDCEVVFGSSNDSATLLAYQQDGTGAAMTASPEQLDTTFGVNGWRDLSFCTAGQFVDVAVHTDGKIYGVANCSNNVIVARFTANGTLDTATYNAPTGYATIDTATTEAAYGIALEPDGDAVVVGQSTNGTNNDVLVARVRANGVLDTAGFNAPNGYRRIDHGVGADRGTSLGIQADGRIVVAGYAATASSNDSLVARLNTDGMLDTAAFNAPTGYLTVDMTQSAADDKVLGMTIDSAGRTVVVGQAQNPATYSMTVGRVLATGALDPAFGPPTGFVKVNLPSYHDDGRTVGELPGGDLLVGGAVGVSSMGYVVRLSPTGSLVTSFGAPNGWLALAPWGSYIQVETTKVLPRPDGTAYVTGRLSAGGLFVGRVDATGWDTKFGGGDGLVVSTIEDENMSAAMQGHQVILSGDFGNNRPSIARFGGPEVSDFANLGGGGDTDWSSGSSTDMFGVCLRQVLGTVAAQWALDADADCTPSDADAWRAIPPTSGPSARVASTTVAGTSTAQARLRFGFRPRLNQPPGRYEAGIVFETVAPAI